MFSYSFHKYLLGTYEMPDTFLGVTYKASNKIMESVLVKLT